MKPVLKLLDPLDKVVAARGDERASILVELCNDGHQRGGFMRNQGSNYKDNFQGHKIRALLKANT